MNVLKAGQFYKINRGRFPTIVEVNRVLSNTTITTRIEMSFWYENSKGIMYKISDEPIIDIIHKDDYNEWIQISI